MIRRDFLLGLGAAASLSLLAGRAAPAAGAPARRLAAGPATAPLTGAEHATAVWAYDGTVPGPQLRLRQGERLSVRFVNGLPQPSTIHWHGVRIDNAMDGVPELTQAAVPPGESFDYDFVVPDAGTFWYHPHNRAWEQIARGLYGLLIVEEAEPPPVDRDLALVFDDWRLGADGEIDADSFGSMMDWSHAGRLGNWLSVNGQSLPQLQVRSGERLRLRLANCANARTMALAFPDHQPQIIALDGQPVAPQPLPDGRLVLAAAQRCDVILDLALAPGSSSAIQEVSYEEPLDAVQIVYRDGPALRASPLDAPVRLADNPVPADLDLGQALAVTLRMEGGAMGGLASARYRGQETPLRELARQHGLVWSFNGVAGRDERPLFEVARRRSVRLEMINDTAWPHAMHLHGHHFRVVARDGRPVAGAPWRDTELVQRSETVAVAFVADNPGRWLLHCHMLEHHAAGMVTWFKVT